MAAKSTFNQWPYIVWNVKLFFQIKQLKSPIFSVQDRSFRLILQQNSFKDISKDFFEIHLEDINLDKFSNNDFVVTTCIRNKTKKDRFPETARISGFDNISQKPIWSRKRKTLLRECEDISDSDETVTFISIFGSEAVPIEDAKEKRTDGYEMFEVFEDDLFLKVLSDDLEKLLYDGKMSDVKVKCGDHVFPLHRAILSARSEIFSEKFNNMGEAEDCSISITDTDQSIFTPLLWFIYTGRLPEFRQSKIPDLYAASDRYKVQTLRERCAYFMTMNLTTDNALNRLVLANSHGDKEFKSNIISFLIKNEKFLKEESWVKFCEECPQLAFEVYRAFVEKFSRKKFRIS